MKIQFPFGSYFEPDHGPGNSPFHKRIVHMAPVQETRDALMLDLECGHKALAFGGDIKQLSGVLFCMQCQDTLRSPAVEAWKC
jgi:hypothetical protein